MNEKHSSSCSRTVAVVSTAIIAPVVVLFVFGGDPVDLIRRSTGAEIAGFLIIIGTGMTCAIIAHAMIRRWFLACTASAIACTFLLQVFSYFSLGYLDAFFLISLVTGTLLGFAVAAVVGLAFYFVRRYGTAKKVA